MKSSWLRNKITITMEIMSCKYCSLYFYINNCKRRVCRAREKRATGEWLGNRIWLFVARARVLFQIVGRRYTRDITKSCVPAYVGPSLPIALSRLICSQHI